MRANGRRYAALYVRHGASSRGDLRTLLTAYLATHSSRSASSGRERPVSILLCELVSIRILYESIVNQNAMRSVLTPSVSRDVMLENGRNAMIVQLLRKNVKPSRTMDNRITIT